MEEIFPRVISPEFMVIGSVCTIYLEMLMCCVDVLLFKEKFVVFGVLEGFEKVFFLVPMSC